MSSKKNIFSTSLQDFRPLIWYGEPIFNRYKNLYSILKEGIGEQYANFFAEPVISKESIEGRGKAAWLSDYVSKPMPFSSLSEQEQEQTKQLLHKILSKIKEFSKELQSKEDASQKEIGELLMNAIEVPGLDYIFVEDNKIVLALWGFTSDKAEKQNFQISKIIAAPPPQPVPPPPPPPPISQPSTPPPPISQPPTPPPPEEKKKKGIPAWLWFIIGALFMFLILFLIWFFLLRNSNTISDLHDNGVLPPVDTTQTGYDEDDPGKKKIFTNKVNIALEKEANLMNFITQLAKKYPDDIKVVYYDSLINLLQIQTPENEWKQWKDSLKSFNQVRLIFSESVFARDSFPSDPDFANAKKSWYFDEIKVRPAWKITKGNPDIVIAIIDNGFDLSHNEFKDKIVKPWNVFTQSDKVFPPKITGGEHGTHVAATALGLADNGDGLCGIAPNCKLMPIQVADKNGTLTSLSIVSGILYAINQEADIVNISLGTYFDTPILSLPESTQEQYSNSLYKDEAQFWDELYLFAEENDILIVQAAGNQNIVTGIDPFARSKRTIVVAATNSYQTKADFSNWGDKSTVSAPGVNIYSATPDNNYKYLQGTSMASPIVAGAAALIKSAHPDWSNEKIIEALVKTAIPIKSDNYIPPMIQLDRAINYNPNDSTLIIPDNADDMSFAKGLWKSDNDLISTIDNKPISLYFNLKEDGTGELTLVESDGTKCIADLTSTFEDGKLIIIQEENAECEDKEKFYRQYQFECVQGKNNEADCTAKEKGGTGDFLDFQLEKQKSNIIE